MYKDKLSFKSESKNCTLYMTERHDIRIRFYNEGIFNQTLIPTIEQDITTFIEAIKLKIRNQDFIIQSMKIYVNYLGKDWSANNSKYYLGHISLHDTSFNANYYPNIDILTVGFKEKYTKDFTESDELIKELDAILLHIRKKLVNLDFNISIDKGLEFAITFKKPKVEEDILDITPTRKEQYHHRNYSEYSDPLEEAMDRLSEGESQGDLFSDY